MVRFIFMPIHALSSHDPAFRVNFLGNIIGDQHQHKPDGRLEQAAAVDSENLRLSIPNRHT